MADKKVERSGRGRPLTPAQKLKSSLSDSGTVSMADPTHDKGKSALVDKFREREERWRQEQALHDRQVARAAEHVVATPENAAETGDVAKAETPPEGGES